MAKKQSRTIVVCSEVVQIALLPEHVENIDSYLIKIQDLMYQVLQLTEDGYSINIQYDPDMGTYSVRLAGITPDKVNTGKLLYGNGESVELAFVSIWIKHFLVSNGSRWEGSQKTTRGLS